MVILLDKHKKPAGFITEKHLRLLCEKHRAVIYRKFPCVAILMDRDVRDFENVRSYRIKIDPGAKNTGLSIICNETDEVVFYQQIEHRGTFIKAGMFARKNARRNRRARETRYRRCKFKDGRNGYDSSREEGWLPPSVKSTADNIINWVFRFKRWVNITKCSVEAVRFDTQQMDNPDIKGVEYQHGTLFGYEIKEYLFEKFGHTCQYCGGESKDSVLEWEHIVPKSRGGSDSVKNATLSCRTCNEAKDKLLLSEWKATIEAKPVKSNLDEARLKGIDMVNEGKSAKSDRYAAWVNSTRRYLEKSLFAIFGEVECSSGGKTKYNREQILHLPKDHHYDSLCVGEVPKEGYKDLTNGYVLMVKAHGRGNRLRGNTNDCGIITIKYKERSKTHKGFMSGDIVKADISKGKHAGHHVGRITIRHRDTFAIQTTNKEKFGVNCNYLTTIQKADGYGYRYERRDSL